jgi:hypothetical protein
LFKKNRLINRRTSLIIRLRQTPLTCEGLEKAMRKAHLFVGGFLGLAACAPLSAMATGPAPLIHLVSGDGLDAGAYAQGNDRTGGMWQGAVAASPSVPQTNLAPESYGRRAWSRYEARPHRRVNSY